MHHKAVAQVTAFLRRNDLPQGHLHLLRLLDAIHQSDFIAQPDAVGVCDDGGLAEHITHDQVGALAAHAGQCQQLFKGGGHFAVVFIPQYPHTGRDIPGLAAAQPTGLDNGFNLLGLCRSQCCYIGIFCKQVLYHNVHPGIGALGRQPDADQQLPGVVIIQRAGCIRIFCFQPVDDLERQLLFGREIFCRSSFLHLNPSFPVNVL